MPSSLINVCKMKAVLLRLRTQVFLQTPNWRPLLGCEDERKEALRAMFCEFGSGARTFTSTLAGRQADACAANNIRQRTCPKECCADRNFVEISGVN
jgi:hypothetical protein